MRPSFNVHAASTAGLEPAMQVPQTARGALDLIQRGSILAGLILVAVTFGACSKTQDTTPGTRLFGNPPVIVSVHLDTSPAQVSCDFTEALTFYYQGQMEQPTSIGGTYSHIKLTVEVTDPDSKGTTDDLTNILLVSASYVVPDSANINTIVLFDDGSPIQSDRTQALIWTQTVTPPLDCIIDPITGGVTCTRASFDLTSGDATANDGIYTRNFAFVGGKLDNSIGAWFKDCIAKQEHEVPQSGGVDANEPISLKIQVVDKQGNLTNATQNQNFTTISTTAACTGDPCACCVLANGVTAATSENGICRGLPGIYGVPTPDGFCNQPIPG